MENNKDFSRSKKFVFRLFESHNLKDPLSMIFDFFYIFLIFFAIGMSIYEVIPSVPKGIAFEVLEYVVLALFVIEWFASFYTAEIEYQPKPFWSAKLAWIVSIESIVDIICLLIFIIVHLAKSGELFVIEETFLSIIILLKLVRFYKLVKYKRSYFNKNKNQEENIVE